MTPGDFAAWLPGAIRDYAADKVAAGNWTDAEALSRSAAEFDKLLPNGPDTPGNHLYSILASPEPGSPPFPIGMIWIAALPERRQAFIYDFVIDPPYRRKGYGAQALRAVEAEVRALGLASIGLHVFGHNHAAQALYTKLGYEITNVNMAKRLSPKD
jgi:ribosomal protein S18 acetylase RimI-like enzyme